MKALDPVHAIDAAPPDDVAANQTYAHLVARWFVRPLVGTPVRPNHITLLRIFVGLAAAALLAVGSDRANFVAGCLWIVACVLDRADGELARLADLRSEFGKRLDYYADLILDAAWFLGAGIGLGHGWLGAAGPVLGALCCVSMIGAQWAGELFERASEPGVRVWGGMRRFHPDDGLFLLGIFPWTGLLAPVLIGSSVVLPLVAVATLARYRALRAGALSGRGLSRTGGERPIAKGQETIGQTFLAERAASCRQADPRSR